MMIYLVNEELIDCIYVETKAGHDLFSSEKPQDIYDQEIKQRREQLNIK
jgi:hypothetical protein